VAAQLKSDTQREAWLITGIPGAGKSTVSRLLAACSNRTRLSMSLRR